MSTARFTRGFHLPRIWNDLEPRRGGQARNISAPDLSCISPSMMALVPEKILGAVGAERSGSGDRLNNFIPLLYLNF